MEQKFYSLLRFMILGLAAAGHHYALTPPSSTSPEEKDIMDGFQVEKEGEEANGGKGDDFAKENSDVLHENVPWFRIGMKLCNWSRVCRFSDFS